MARFSLNTRRSLSLNPAQSYRILLSPQTGTFRWFCGAYLLILGMTFLILPQGALGIWLQPIWFYGACIAGAGLGTLWLAAVNLPKRLTIALSVLTTLPLLVVVAGYVSLASILPAVTLGLLMLGILCLPFGPAQPQTHNLPDLLGVILGILVAGFGIDLLTRPGAAVAVPPALGLSPRLVSWVFIGLGVAVVAVQLVRVVPGGLRKAAHLAAGGALLAMWIAQCLFIDSLYWILGAASVLRGLTTAFLPWWSRRAAGVDTQGVRLRNALSLFTAALIPVLIAVPLLLHTVGDQMIGRAPIRSVAFGLTILLALGAGIIGWWFSGRLTAPLTVLTQRVNRIANGAYDTELPQNGLSEINALSLAVEQMAQALEARNRESLHLTETIRGQLAEIESIYDNAPIGLCVLDRDLRYVRINERLAEINGIPAAQHIGRTVRELVPQLADTVVPAFQRVLDTGVPMLDVELEGETAVQPGVTRYWIEQWLPLKDHAGQVAGISVVVQEITERKRSELALRASEARYRALADLSPDTILVNANGRYVYANAAAARLMGGDSPQDIIGRSPFEFLDPEYHDLVRERVRLALEEQRPTPLIEYRWKRLDGSRVDVDVIAGPFDWEGTPAVQVVARDITLRKQAEERTARLQEITAALAATVTTADVETVFMTLVVKAVGASRGGIVRLVDDQTLETVVTQNVPNSVAREWQRFPLDMPAPLPEAIRAMTPIWMESPEAWRARSPLPPPDDHHAWAALPLIINGRPTGGIGLSFAEPRTFSGDDKTFMLLLAAQCAQALWRADLYAQVQAHAETLQQKVEERTKELQQALARAESADRAKSRMLANVSHEMRTPLSSIVGFSTLILQRNPDGDKLREFATLINSEGRRLARLVNDFLDLQRIEAGRDTFRLASTDLAALVRDVAAHYDLGDKPKHTIQVNVDSTAPIQADSDRIRQVILNLLSNAVKFSPDGGTIQLELRQQDSEVVCAIRDQGMGILPGELPSLFERFQRSESAEYLRIQGTGLGLALCKEIIQHHNGRIWAESAGEGQGATFNFALPVLEPETPIIKVSQL